VTVSFVYRIGERITKRVEFTGYTSGGVPQGRTINHKGISLGVRELSAKERKAWKSRQPGQTIIEMGHFSPYESVTEEASHYTRIRSFAPPRRIGRGARTIEFSPAGDRLPNLRQPDRRSWGKGLF
jgi:hypothetical protein